MSIFKSLEIEKALEEVKSDIRDIELKVAHLEGFIAGYAPKRKKLATKAKKPVKKDSK